MSENKIKKCNWVVGSPIDHSMSPVLHDALYQELGINAVMQAREYTDPELLIRDIKSQSIELTAVTMPLKEKVVDYLDGLHGDAKKVGIVNTIVQKNNKLIGYNTDIEGFRYALQQLDLNNKAILIIGAGAVAKLMGYYLHGKSEHLYWLNRTVSKAEVLKKQYGGLVVQPQDLNKTSIDVIINTTPIGMLSCPGNPLSPEFIKSGQTVFDVVYNPLETELLKSARKNGALCISGLEMFAAQAVAQVEYWQGEKLFSSELLRKIKSTVVRGIEK